MGKGRGFLTPRLTGITLSWSRLWTINRGKLETFPHQLTLGRLEQEFLSKDARKKLEFLMLLPPMIVMIAMMKQVLIPTFKTWKKVHRVTIKKYDPKATAAIKKRTEDDQYLISPITGEKIPASKAAEHMKVGLLDPRWVEERDKHISAKANEEVVFAPGQSIESSLKQLAERRTDIFGVGEEAAQETAIGQKMGEEEKLAGEKVTWDGHSSSAEAAARAARANISLDDQIAQIHRQKGLIPDQQDSKTVVVAAPPQPAVQQVQMVPPMIVGVPMRPAMVVPTPVFVPTRQMAPVYIQPNMDDDEPASKRQRTEENLIPEGEFLARNLSPVTFKVMVPQMPDKPEWKLDGQILSLTLQLTDTVNTIKQRIMEELGMPQGKQKLQHENIFFKDANSLAYYNVTPGTMLNLQLKERGGRKK